MIDEKTVVLIWRIACAVAAVYLAFHGDWVPSAIFALAAK